MTLAWRVQPLLRRHEPLKFCYPEILPIMEPEHEVSVAWHGCIHSTAYVVRRDGPFSMLRYVVLIWTVESLTNLEASS